MASDLTATVTTHSNGCITVAGYEALKYEFEFVNGVFDPLNPQLASQYKRWRRCLAIVDINVAGIYGNMMRAYFEHHGIELEIYEMRIGEQAKTMDTMLQICSKMTAFGVFRKEPVLVVGGGLTTDVAGFACAAYRRSTNYIRIPTTVIGLIDASVSIKVAVNHGGHKNRLGAYHAPMQTYLDFGFLKTLPTAQVRNGFAELIKISTCAHLETFELLDKYCEDLIATHFGELCKDVNDPVRLAAGKINREAILVMLQIESPNLHEIGLDRIIAYGHTWSPTLELAPNPPLRHGHAISVDMAYSATLAYSMGVLSQTDHARIIALFNRAGLSVDHELFTSELIAKATDAILKTRDGKLRAAIPKPLGQCIFLNDVSKEVMDRALAMHKQYVKTHCARQGAGIDAYVDASDTGVECMTDLLNESTDGKGGDSDASSVCSGVSTATQGKGVACSKALELGYQQVFAEEENMKLEGKVRGLLLRDW